MASLCTSAMQQNAKKQKHANSFHFCCFPALSADQQLFSVVRRRNKGGGERSRSDKISGQRLGSRSDGTAPPKSGDQRIDTGRTGTGPLPERSKGYGDSFMDWRSAYRCFGAS